MSKEKKPEKIRHLRHKKEKHRHEGRHEGCGKHGSGKVYGDPDGGRTRVLIRSGEFRFTGILLDEEAPETCRAFRKMLPLKNKMIHVRWSGEGLWIPYGETRVGLEYENHTSHPAKGEMLLYPGGISEMEIILAYGRCCFACQHGQLSGNHFLTITEGLERLAEFGKKALWEGAQETEILLLEPEGEDSCCEEDSRKCRKKARKGLRLGKRKE